MAKEIGQLNVKIALDSTGFQNGIGALNREMKKVQSEFKLASAEMGKHGKELDSLKLKSDNLTKQTELQRQKVQALEAAHQKSVETKGKDVKATQDLEIKLDQAKTQLVNMEQDLKKLNKEIEAQSTSWGKLSKALEPIGKAMQDMGKKMESAGKKLSTTVTAPLVGLGTAAFLAADNVKGATDIIRQSTGKTGEDFKALEGSFKKVFADAPDSAETVAGVLAKLNVSTEATGKELERLTTPTLDYAKVNRVDAATSADVLGRLMNALEVDISQLPGVMDKLTKASQMSGIEVNQLAGYVIEAGPAFEEMGFGLDKSIALFAQFYKAGANPRETLSSLNKVLNTMAKEGATNAEEAFKLLLEKIKAAPDILSATTIASEAFGSRVGAKVAEDIRAGRFEVDAWVEALQTADGTVQTAADETGKFGEKLAVLRNKATLAFEPFGKSLVDALGGALEAIRPMINAIAGLAKWFADLEPGVQKNIIVIAGLVAAIGPVVLIAGKVVSAIGAVVGVLSTVSGAIAVATTGAVAATPAVGALATAFTVLTGPVGLAVAAIAGITVAGIALHKHLSQDSIPAVKLFGDEVSESTKQAVGGFLELNDEATSALNQLSWSGQEVTKEMAGKVAGNFTEMASQVQAGLDKHHRESLAKIQGFVTSSTSLSQQEQEEILTNMQLGYENRKLAVAESEARIKEILGIASAEKRALTKSEQEEINAIQKTMVETGIQVLSENEVEAKAIMERMKAQAGEITALQAAEVVKNSLEQRDKTIKATNEQYDQVVKEIIRQRDETGSITKDQADRLIKEATRQKDDTVARAEEMHLRVVDEAKAQAQEHVNQVDWETGEIKTKWQAMKDDIAAKAQAIKENVSKTWEEIKKDSYEKWENIRSTMSDKWDNIKTKTAETVAAIKANVSTTWDEVKTKTYETWDNIKTKTADTWAAIQNKIDEHGGGIKGLIGTYTEGYKSVWDGALTIMEEITGGKFSAMADKVSDALDRVKNAISVAIDRIKEWNATSVKEKVFSIVERITRVISTVTSGGGADDNYSGTSFFPGGLTMVGELGPELVALPRGARIYNDHETREILGGNKGITQNIVINSPTPLTPAETARQIKNASRQLALEW
jgi:TP901 family phage tail tape measure protein